MRYILIMGLSGSSMFLLYCLIKVCMAKYLTRQRMYTLLKIAAVYFLLPLPFLGEFYRRTLDLVLHRERFYPAVYHSADLVVIDTGEQVFWNQTLGRRLWAAGIWLGVALAIMLFLTGRHLYRRRKLLRCGLQEASGGDMELLRRLCGEMGIRRSVRLYCVADRHMTFTVGYFRPVILWRRPEGERERIFLLRHELTHIRRGDVLWKIIGNAVLIVHWYNPLVYLLWRELENRCEEACDACVVSGCDIEERRAYARMLVNYASRQEGRFAWRAALSRRAKELSRRTGYVLQEAASGWPDAVVIPLLVLLVWGNSVTALAYEETKLVRIDERSAGILGLENGQRTDGEFVSDWDAILRKLEVYDLQPEAMTHYQYGGYSMVMAMNNDHEHVFAFGLYEQHIAGKDGGCRVTLYEAMRCSRCGQIWPQEPLVMDIYPRCVH